MNIDSFRNKMAMLPKRNESQTDNVRRTKDAEPKPE